MPGWLVGVLSIGFLSFLTGGIIAVVKALKEGKFNRQNAINKAQRRLNAEEDKLREEIRRSFE